VSKANAEVVQKMLNAFVAGEVDVAHGYMADDIVLREPPSLPYGGDFRGHAGWGKMMATFLSVWEPRSEFDFTVVDGEGDRVFLLVTVDVASVATGRSLTLRIVEVYTVREGQIVEIDVFYKDTAAMLAAIAG
jgi:ketosteroid isomerase-like protein